MTGTGPLSDFARDLRDLRGAAGLTYEELARRAHYSKSSLNEAARGRQLPSLELTLAFAGACGADVEAWRDRWYQVRAVVDPAEVGAPPVPLPLPLDVYQAPPSRRPVRWLAVGLVVGVAAAVVWFVVARPFAPTTTSHPPADAASRSSWRSLSEALPTPGKPADAMDPIRADCGSPDVAGQVITQDEVPVRLPSGTDFGVLRLRHNPKCQASWGQVAGPHGAQRRVHIVARRPADHVAAPSEFAGKVPASYGNMLRTTKGCVYVEAYVETPEGNGPAAKTRCA